VGEADGRFPGGKLSSNNEHHGVAGPDVDAHRLIIPLHDN
jgi:hypothetical protein